MEEFAPRFLEGYAVANQQKPSGIAGKESVLRAHLVPLLGGKRLDQITTEDVQRLKSSLAKKAGKTVNNVLTVLNTMLRTAVKSDLLESMPCSIRLLKVCKSSVSFYELEDFERLVGCATEDSETARLIVLLGGEAGLRCGEMMAFEALGGTWIWPEVLGVSSAWLARSGRDTSRLRKAAACATCH